MARANQIPWPGNTPGELCCVQGAESVWAQPLIPSQARLICPCHRTEWLWLPVLLLLPGMDVPVITSLGITAVEQGWSSLEECEVPGLQGNAAPWALLQCGLNALTLEAFWLNRNVSVRGSEVRNVQFVLVPCYSGSPLFSQKAECETSAGPGAREGMTPPWAWEGLMSRKDRYEKITEYQK